jgi:hypothetical protein
MLKDILLNMWTNLMANKTNKKTITLSHSPLIPWLFPFSSFSILKKTSNSDNRDKWLAGVIEIFAGLTLNDYFASPWS